MGQPDDPGIEAPPPRPTPWWQTGPAIASLVLTLVGLIVGASVVAGRSLQRIDDLDSKLTGVASTLEHVVAVTNDTSVNVARIQGALGVSPSRKAEWRP